jgi:hypothetical protein
MTTSVARGNIRFMFAVAVTFDPAAVATITTAEQTVTVTGAAVGDFVIAMKPSITTGVTIGNVRVSAANTVAIQFVNPTAGSVNPASETWQFLILRPEYPAANLGSVVPAA